MGDMTDANAPSGTRLAWVDYAKGVAIFLVVFGHAIGGMLNAGLVPSTRALTITLDWMYAFHMPVFFFLAGLFATRAVSRPFGTFFIDKAKTIVYPYVIWATAQQVLQVVLARYANHPASLSSLLRIPYDPPAQFWFLYALFLIMLLYAGLFRLHAGPWAFLIGMVAFYATSEWLGLGPWGAPYAVRGNALYLAFGVLAGERLNLARLRQVRAATLGAATALGYLAVLCFAWGDWSASVVGKPLAALCGGSATIAAAFLLERWDAARFVRGWGQLSLEIYVAHTIASAAVRVLAVRLLGEGLWGVHLALGVVAGLYLPIALVWACRQVGFAYLFSLRPRQPVRNAVA